MKKLFFLIPTLEAGGAEKVLVDLVNNLNKEKYDITVKTLLSGGAFNERLNDKIKYSSIINIRNKVVRKILFYSLSFILPHKVAYRITNSENYDIEIAYLEGIPTEILAASRNRTSKIIAFVHSDLSSNYQLSKYYKTVNDCLEAYKLFDKVVFVSDSAKDGFEKTIGNLAKSIVLHNVLDQNVVLKLSKESVPERKTAKFLFISVGRLCNQKGYDRLLKTAALLNRDKYSFEIWIIGEGEDRGKLEILCRENDLKNVKLLGFKANPYPYIALSEMFICSSRVEGYSTAITEALTMKIPILTTDCAGMNEILDYGKYGIIVENSIQGIYLGMKRILDSHDEYNRLLMMAKERSEYFSMDKSIYKYEALFDEV